MKAKFVYESIRDILRPKSQEEILNSIEINSYRLSSFLNITDIKIASILRGICKHLNVSPEDMNICKPHEYIINLFKRAFTEYNYVNDKFKFEISDKYKMIRFGNTYRNFHGAYYIFPRKEINKILTELIFK
jgi:DNA-binding Xre family transcriptional regulator